MPRKPSRETQYASARSAPPSHQVRSIPLSRPAPDVVENAAFESVTPRVEKHDLLMQADVPTGEGMAVSPSTVTASTVEGSPAPAGSSEGGGGGAHNAMPAANEGTSVQRAELPALTSTQRGAPELKMAPLMDVKLKVSVILGEATLTLGEILRLGAGAIIELNTPTGEPISVYVNDRLFAKGEVVVVEESFGIRIVEIVDQIRAKAAA